MEGVVHETFVRKEVHSEQATDLLHVGHRPSQEVPALGIGVPPAGVLRQDLWRVMDGVERDRQQDELASQPGLETPLQDAKVVGDSQAEIRQWATRVDEIDGHDLAAQL